MDSPQLATDLVATSAIDGVFCLPLFAKQGSGAAVFLAIHIMRPPTQRLRGKQKFDMASGDQ